MLTVLSDIITPKGEGVSVMLLQI